MVIDKEEVINLIEMWKLDKNIAELVIVFNKIGLQTIFSCEGCGNNKPYIMFSGNQNRIEDIIINLYSNFSHGAYLDIGSFKKLCTPIVTKINDEVEYSFNSNWIWEGEYWLREDYIFKINRLTKMLKQIY